LLDEQVTTTLPHEKEDVLYCLTPAHNTEFWKSRREPVNLLLVGLLAHVGS